ncbi:glycoside hydrolase [Pyrenochaeta sp. DS3sAY3a]|nr:glycoside hydrolase [Pyrenochaeta sp. DS3sAY3a]
MKSLTFVSALAAVLLLGTASGRPLNAKRAVTTEVVYVTVSVANVIVYVDENGAPYQTSTAMTTNDAATSLIVSSTTSDLAPPTLESTPAAQLPSTSDAPAPAPGPTLSQAAPELAPSEVVPPPAAVTSTAVENQTPTEPTNVPPPPPTSTPEEPTPPTQLPPPPAPQPSVIDSQDNGHSNRLGMGVTYDPFTGSQDSARCKTEEEIADEWDKMKDYKAIRIYGMGCNIIPLAVKNVIQRNQKLMAGVYMSTRGNGEDMTQVIQSLKSAVDQYAGGNWDVVQLFSVENERVNDHDMTVSSVVDAINNARGQLRSLGYNGPVGAVETVPATIQNPALCEASDVVMVNCHAFFDTNTKAEDAGQFVKSEIERVKSACNSKRVVITESGWPHQGDANGQAVPSMENQRKALDSIRSNFDGDIFLHNSFDSTWKSDWASSFNAERFWGVIH